MTKTEYFEKMKALKAEFDTKRKELIKKCVLENAKYKVGDIIKNGSFTIVIEKIISNMIWSDSFPGCGYYGTELKKDLTPRKDGSTASIFDGNPNDKIIVVKIKE